MRQNWMTILLLVLKRSRINQTKITAEIAEFQEDDEIIDDETAFATGKWKWLLMGPWRMK